MSDGSPDVSEPLRELHEADIEICVEPIDQVHDHDLKSHEPVSFGLQRAVREPLRNIYEKLVIVDLERDVDRTRMILVVQEQRESLIDGEAKVIDCSYGQSFASSQ
ncbi:MAG: hypothetical protein ACI81L_002765 [Verrucomicrobiales bacterium]|jgi:hypothetical protein